MNVALISIFPVFLSTYSISWIIKFAYLANIYGKMLSNIYTAQRNITADSEFQLGLLDNQFMRILSALLIFLNINFALGAEFKFNNKNLNTLGALICDLSSSQTTKGTIIAHKLDLEVIRTGSTKTDVSYLIEGSCNIKINAKSKKTVSYGDTLSIKLNANEKIVKGSLGINELILSFKDGELDKLTINDPLMLTTKTIKVQSSEWAINDQIFNFNKKSSIKLELSRNIAATETDSVLSFNHGNKSKFFNLWNYQSYGCSNKFHTIDNELCYKLIE